MFQIINFIDFHANNLIYYHRQYLRDFVNHAELITEDLYLIINFVIIFSIILDL